MGAASFVASPRRCWSSLSQARPSIRYGGSAYAPITSSDSILDWLGDQGGTASSSSTTPSPTAPFLFMHLTYGVGFGVRVPCVGTLQRHACAVGARQAQCPCPPTIPAMWPSARGHRGHSTAANFLHAKRVRTVESLVRVCCLLPNLGAPSLLPRHSPSRVNNHLKVFTDVSRSGDGKQSKDKSKTMHIISTSRPTALEIKNLGAALHRRV